MTPDPAHPIASESPAALAAASPSDLVLRWLIPLRFVAAAGQAAALLAGELALGLPLPYRALWWVPALIVLSNLALFVPAVRTAPAARVVPAVLLLDTALFTFLLQESGGPDNPFSALYAIHIAMAAMTGSARATWAVALASAAGYALVFRWHETQHFWHGPAPFVDVGLHALGMWLAVAVVAVVITLFIGRVTRTLRERETELRRVQEVAARSARLASLTTLAAGAAHELGSPLGTIAVVARELERAAAAPGAPPSLAEDARLLRAEADRCRAILDRMSARAGPDAAGAAEPLAADAAAAAVAEAIGPDAARRLELTVHAPDGASLGPRGDFLEVVLPIVRNAFDASPPAAPVRVEVAAVGNRLRVVARDEGHGMDAATLARAGEPFFTTRPPGRGTGLGLFVVRLHAERLGGALRLESTPGRGTIAIVEWPRGAEPAEGARLA
ncbi:MAG TPA: HAMP domain-containing sensor histidine kinase [Myxococcota bacterium]|nr:HAMP domain-containing sensor histidine kinase [Myxococcota bacterium]